MECHGSRHVRAKNIENIELLWPLPSFLSTMPFRQSSSPWQASSTVHCPLSIVPNCRSSVQRRHWHAFVCQGPLVEVEPNQNIKKDKVDLADVMRETSSSLQHLCKDNCSHHLTSSHSWLFSLIHRYPYTGVPWWHQGLRIQHFHCSSSGHCCGVELIPGPGTSTCRGCGQKIK